METITTIQQVPASLGAVDGRGNPVALPGFSTPPAWKVDNPAILTLQVSTDGLSCTCVAAGAAGLATISVTGTPVGASSPLTGSAQVQVNAVAASFVITFGAATQQTPPTPPPPPAP